MRVEVRKTDHQDVRAMRDLYRQEANCQIVHDAAIPRGRADAYLILVDGAVGGYGGVYTQYHEGRIAEFYTLPHLRSHALSMFRDLLAATGATHAEAQTNMPLMLHMLYECAANIAPESLLFHDAAVSHLPCPRGAFRRAQEGDGVEDPANAWVVADEAGVIATGGFLCHYNPPYGDVYMEVVPDERRRGFGSYIVQELKRVCYEAGKRPSARCNPDNAASRRALEKAGFLPCGYLLAGEVVPPQV